MARDYIVGESMVIINVHVAIWVVHTLLAARAWQLSPRQRPIRALLTLSLFSTTLWFVAAYLFLLDSLAAVTSIGPAEHLTNRIWALTFDLFLTPLTHLSPIFRGAK